MYSSGVKIAYLFGANAANLKGAQVDNFLLVCTIFDVEKPSPSVVIEQSEINFGVVVL